MSDADPVTNGLRDLLARQLGDDGLQISDLRRHIEGFSWETWELTATWTHEGRPQQRRLIVRRVPQAGLMPPYDVPGQWELARALQSAPGVPVPEPLWVDAEGLATGRPLYVMEHVVGDIPVPWNVHDYFPDARAQERIGHQLMDVLAAIGSIDLDTLPAGLRGRDDPDPAAEVWYWLATYERVRAEPVPALERAFGWLQAHSGDVSGQRALVHGDFRIGNAILRDGEVVAMLDWEVAHVGDPAEDVANFCMRLYQGKRRIPGGLMATEDVLDSHERAAGWRVSEAALKFWLVFGDVRSVVSFLIAERIFADGETRDLRYAAFSHHTPYLMRHLMADLTADA
jgi:aminoglycoside phosphotransferase (APT) family kinase protein